MALNKTVLGALMKAKIDLVPFNSDPNVYRTKLMEAMADAIITHFTTAAVISSTVTVASVSAVTPGAGVSGPGAGTATGTIG